jgi:signal transduction histidine kinase
MIFAVQEATLLGLAGAVSLLIGAVLSVAGYITNRRTAAEKTNEELHKQLIESREEAERLSNELHELRRAQSDE